LERKILANLKPEELGLRFEPVREQALKAARESQDFGGLFLGFSFFLIIAALLLMAMLFQFGLEQRAAEIGTLLALGFTPKQVRKIFLREGAALALGGGIIGAVGGIYFAKAMLHGLSTVWRDAVGATSLSFHVTSQTLVVGLLASVVVSTITLGLALRRFVKLAPRELLVGEIHAADSNGSRPRSKLIAGTAAVLALGLAGWTLGSGDTANAGAFFGAGALVLVAGLSFVSAWLVKLAGAPINGSAPIKSRDQQAEVGLGAPFSAVALAVRGCARRRKRSLATVAMLACGSFLIVSIGVFRLDANRDATQRSSGTGGFALFGETTLPVVQDLNGASGRDFFALNEQDLIAVTFVPFRVRPGDEASCLNLNRAQRPRLLGVKPEAVAGRFTFARWVDDEMRAQPWLALKAGEFYPKYDQPLATNEIAAIGDANSIQWAMKKKVGDTIDYVDERGQPFQVRIVGAVANSILQGQLIIDEAEFVKRFPGESGHRMFLIDAPTNAVAAVSATLSRALQDVGLELVPTATRLNQFNAVQNTYLGTFQVLGGLGLLLGSVGLGVVVLRNALERRSELAVLLAVGFRRRQVQRLLLAENGALLFLGLGIGASAATVAVLPALLAPNVELPWLSLGVTLAAVLLNGLIWTWLATRLAVRGDLLAALRNE
jgi:ABC-type antimicrobial peptide transport system permease subunit